VLQVGLSKDFAEGLGISTEPFFVAVRFVGAMAYNGWQLNAGRVLNHCTFYEELNFKYTTFLSYEAQNPCLRLGAVMPSLFFFVRCGWAAILFGKFWLVWLD